MHVSNTKHISDKFAPMIVRGKRIHEDFIDSTSNSKCEKLLKALSKKKSIPLTAIGSRSNNLLVDFLKCHTKVLSKDYCKPVEKVYKGCHSSVMGTGNYNGAKDCGNELQEWMECCMKMEIGRKQRTNL